MVPGIELSLTILLNLDIHGIEMTVDIVKTQVPDTFMTMFRGMMEIESKVQPVIGRQRKIVRTLIDKLTFLIVRRPAIRNTRCVDPL